MKMTDTLEIAKKCGGIGNGTRTCPISLTSEELQAFREAVEAESDAERMKQPAVAWQHPMDIGRFNTATAKKEHDEQVGLYAQPFPSTEQLQQRVKELAETLHKVAEFCERESTASRYAFSNRINAEKELTTKLAAFDALASNIKKALANTQGDSK